MAKVEELYGERRKILRTSSAFAGDDTPTGTKLHGAKYSLYSAYQVYASPKYREQGRFSST